MDITVYLPDELGEWAKAQGINLSHTLRLELEAARERDQARAETLDEAEEIQVDLEDDNGRAYVGKFEGTLLAEGREADAYLAADDRILVHDREKGSIVQVEEAEELRGWLQDNEAFIEACAALGETAVVDI